MDLSPPLLTRELLASGMTRRAISRAVGDRTLAQVRHGAYYPMSQWEALTPSQRYQVRTRAVLKTLQRPAALSHVTAAVEYGAPLWGLDLRDTHLTMLDGRAERSSAGVRQHRGKALREDMVERGAIVMVDPVRAAVEAASLCSVQGAVVLVDALMREGLFTVEQFRERAEEMRHWPGTLSMNLVTRIVDRAHGSVAESRTACIMHVHHLPPAVAQLHVRLPDGQDCLLDFAWPELGAWLEFDGKEKYVKHLRPGESAADAVVREKRREDAIRAHTGWRCLRITWADLEDPARLARRIRDFLAAAPRVPVGSPTPTTDMSG